LATNVNPRACVTALSSLVVRWTVLIIAAVLVTGAGLAIIRSMWGMRAPLARGASTSTETLWLFLPLAMSVTLVAWTAWVIS
jgi:hypothetical protein